MSSNNLKNIFCCGVVFLAIFGVVNTTSAGVAPIDASDCTTWGINCTGTDTPTDLRNYFWAGVQVVLSFVSIIAAAALVYYGILYIISRGEEDKARQAKTGIVYALIGLLVVGIAAWLVNAIINL